jgi:Na+/H+-dicarboxylate symporter
MVPTNVVAAAASDAIVPLVLFALLLGIAVTRIGEAEHRAAVTALFAGFADALLVIVGWILALAPLGVFALAITAGARLGMDAGAALAFYVGLQIVLALILTLLMVLLAATLGGTSPARFAAAAAPAQAVALSTQSSLASLPAMLAGAQRLGLAEQSTAVVLPLAVATFKISAPLTGVVVGLTLAKLAGVEVGGWQLLAGILLAAISTLAVVGLPGQVSFFAANAPPALAMGAPIELMPLLLAIDTLPDMIRTVANVTADLAATAVIAAQSGSVTGE